MPENRTTVQVSVKTWQYLNSRKHPGESMDEVLQRELGIEDDRDEQQNSEADGGDPRIPPDADTDYSGIDSGLDDAPDSS